MSIQIGTIKSIGRTEGLEITPDDRQELVKTVNNTGTETVTVEDYGVVADGEVISLEATFLPTDYNTLRNYWTNRTPVTVILDDGTTTINNARIVIRRIQYYDKLMPTRKTVQLEVWRK